MSDNVLVLCHGSLLYLNTEVNLVALDLNETSFYVELLLTVLFGIFHTTFRQGGDDRSMVLEDLKGTHHTRYQHALDFTVKHDLFGTYYSQSQHKR